MVWRMKEYGRFLTWKMRSAIILKCGRWGVENEQYGKKLRIAKRRKRTILLSAIVILIIELRPFDTEEKLIKINN